MTNEYIFLKVYPLIKYKLSQNFSIAIEYKILEYRFLYNTLLQYDFSLVILSNHYKLMLSYIQTPKEIQNSNIYMKKRKEKFMSSKTFLKFSNSTDFSTILFFFFFWYNLPTIQLLCSATMPTFIDQRSPSKIRSDQTSSHVIGQKLSQSA